MAYVRRELEGDAWHLYRPDFGDDAYRYFNDFVHGASLQSRLYARREGIPALLCVSFIVYVLDARTRCCHQHLPDVYLLRDGGSVVISSDRLLL